VERGTRFTGRWRPQFRRAGPVPVDPWDAAATAEFLDAARESAVRGQTIMLESAPQ
jgi:hypothetical protein